MKVVYPIYCGIDAHKSFPVAMIISSNVIQPHYLKKRFSTFNEQIRLFKQWLIAHDCPDVCMESTGRRTPPLANIRFLSSIFLKTLCHYRYSKVVKAVKGNKYVLDYLLKTDTIDPDHVSSLLQGTLNKKTESVLESIDGYIMLVRNVSSLRLPKCYLLSSTSWLK